MTRVKRGVVAHKKRKRTLKYTKGYRWGRKSKERAAKEALLHAWSHAYRGRKQKKRDFRAAWQAKINAAARNSGTTYSTLMHTLKQRNIKLDRKILADLAENEPETFKKIVSETVGDNVSSEKVSG
jgi:large subunit ribosomal protein L20